MRPTPAAPTPTEAAEIRTGLVSDFWIAWHGLAFAMKAAFADDYDRTLESLDRFAWYYIRCWPRPEPAFGRMAPLIAVATPGACDRLREADRAVWSALRAWEASQGPLSEFDAETLHHATTGVRRVMEDHRAFGIDEIGEPIP